LQRVFDNQFPEFNNRIKVKGIGSKTKIDGTLAEARRKGELCFAIRDRDFLPDNLVEERNAYPFKNEQACSLQRHCIESYLLDDEALTQSQQALRDQEAESRKWVDLARAVKETGVYKIRNRKVEPPLDTESVTDEETARHWLHEFFAKLGSLVECDTELAQIKVDFERHPLWKRVDGKELLKRLHKAGFRDPPAPEPASLIAELRLLISQMPNDW
jgi:hypothetical protein